MANFMRESIVFCSTCTMFDVVVKKFTFAVSSPDELLVLSIKRVINKSRKV